MVEKHKGAHGSTSSVFWVVTSFKRHGSYASAERQRAGLARQYPGREFQVVRCVAEERPDRRRAPSPGDDE